MVAVVGPAFAVDVEVVLALALSLVLFLVKDGSATFFKATIYQYTISYMVGAHERTETDELAKAIGDSSIA